MRSYRIGTVMGIPIQINVSLLVFLPLLAWLLGRPRQIELYAGLIEATAARPIETTPLVAGNVPTIIGIGAALGLFVSVLLHELGHSWVARRYDIPIASITLWIFGGVASMERIPREWDREFWIAIAGPITSVLVGLVCYALLYAVPDAFPVLVFLVGWLAVVNVILAAFNLLPAFPMDGGRILRALLARSRPYVDATRTAAGIGRWMAIGLAILAVLGFNVVLLLVALFIYGAATSESRAVVLDDLLNGVTARDLVSADLRTVPAEASVSDLVGRMFAERTTGFPVVDDRGSIVGIVDLDDLKGVREVERDAILVEDVMSPDVRTVAPDLPAFELLRQFDEPGVSRVIVAADEPIGSVSREDVGRTLTVLRGVGRSERAPAWTDGVR